MNNSLAQPVTTPIDNGILDEKFRELKSLLEKTSPTKNYDFLIELFVEIANWINLDKAIEKKVFQHNLLTKCYLLDTALQLIRLLQKANNNALPLKNLEYQIAIMSKQLNDSHPLPQSWKFFHLAELKKINLNREGICQLLLAEIKNYMWGIEAITKASKFYKVLVKSICTLLTNKVTHHLKANLALQEQLANFFNCTNFYLDKIAHEKQTFFYSRCARELVKFYVATENKNWTENNKIPSNNPLFLDELLDWLAFAKELALTLNDYSFIKKIIDLQDAIQTKTLSKEKSYQPYFFSSNVKEIDDKKPVIPTNNLDLGVTH